MSSSPRRGDIYWVSLDPTIGAEAKKTRPGLIVSNDIGNQHSNRVIVIPVTSNIRKVFPFELQLDLPKGPSKAMVDQIRTVDKKRLLNKVCHIPVETMRDIDKIIKFVLALS